MQRVGQLDPFGAERQCRYYPRLVFRLHILQSEQPPERFANGALSFR